MTWTRERRCELLAEMAEDTLVGLAERAMADAEAVAVLSPEVGMVMLDVREPIAEERFHLGEVLVTRAEVERRGHRGWAMRMGRAPLAALAAAVLDTELEAAGPLAAEIEAVLAETERDLRFRADAEWAELAPTEVRFEVMEQ
ncbi:MAG: phosphonate C-P lyase system protein PhnG [Actinomycetota bacterium]|nr:phosphonate C-P lyase system protein PhnG [Actinomycetota bacterium]